MTIQERVIAAFQSSFEGDAPAALAHICIAAEMTAKKALNKPQLSAAEFKKFVRRYYPVQEPFVGLGVNLADSKFPSIPLIAENGKRIAAPDFADIVHHALAAARAQETIGDKFQFAPAATPHAKAWAALEGGAIRMPLQALWALIALSVFCEANGDIGTRTGLWLLWGDEGRQEPYRFDIDLFWGAERTVRRFFEKRNLARIAMKY